MVSFLQLSKVFLATQHSDPPRRIWHAQTYWTTDTDPANHAWRLAASIWSCALTHSSLQVTRHVLAPLPGTIPYLPSPTPASSAHMLLTQPDQASSPDSIGDHSSRLLTTSLGHAPWSPTLSLHTPATGDLPPTTLPPASITSASEAPLCLQHPSSLADLSFRP